MKFDPEKSELLIIKPTEEGLYLIQTITTDADGKRSVGQLQLNITYSESLR